MHKLDHKICVAPMMTHTDRHFRYFLRLLSRHVMLYTEMVTTGALIHGPADKLMRYNPEEHPLAIQLGGSEPEALARCARMAAAAGYDEVNLNIGCPSDRVQSGKIGACLMAESELVAECVAAMAAVIGIPVTVKCRIGIDANDSYEALFNFVRLVAKGGCTTFIIHARKACLQGLSPRQNREVPPLKYDFVHRIKRDFPELEIIINGGITAITQIQEQLQTVDGVMIGRAMCNNPYLLSEIERTLYKHPQPQLTRNEILEAYIEYVSKELVTGTPLSYLTRNIIGMFHGRAGSRLYRRYLSENMYRRDSGIEVIRQALTYV
ncbi:MAG: tRNA dihydrouridine(20/20a) synthase DusA [Gammaproteobacteria bacterium RIFCSPLOWO2_02_FULL_52_10]|nr:MAG: tRNA dihydrouridine(20/20a) synthase DusA [Gammaproteobacteria bacterium RIFCSPLOWO2_02_FULL_52_10]